MHGRYTSRNAHLNDVEADANGDNNDQEDREAVADDDQRRHDSRHIEEEPARVVGNVAVQLVHVHGESETREQQVEEIHPNV